MNKMLLSIFILLSPIISSCEETNNPKISFIFKRKLKNSDETDKDYLYHIDGKPLLPKKKDKLNLNRSNFVEIAAIWAWVTGSSAATTTAAAATAATTTTASSGFIASVTAFFGASVLTTAAPIIGLGAGGYMCCKKVFGKKKESKIPSGNNGNNKDPKDPKKKPEEPVPYQNPKKYDPPNFEEKFYNEKTPNGIYENNPKHHMNSKGNVSKPAVNGQESLNKSVSVPGSSKRVGIENGKYVVFQEHQPGKYHGYIVEEWNQLEHWEKNALCNGGFVKSAQTGKIRRWR